MNSEDSAASDQKKTKQERIRDNQRRSRARRQEHLAELEQRLRDSQAKCREADVQRIALQELQSENARLRDLLRLMGMSPEYIQNFLHSRSGEGTESIRVLRPKVNVGQFVSGSHSSSTPDPGSSAAFNSSAPTPSDSGATSVSASMGLTQAGLQHENAHFLSVPVYHPDLSHMSTQPSLPPSTSATDGELLWCDSFLVPNSAPLQPTTADTTLCSVAKELISHYGLDDEEMQFVAERLSTGFARPAAPGEGCRVTNELLLEILNELNSRWS